MDIFVCYREFTIKKQKFSFLHTPLEKGRTPQKHTQPFGKVWGAFPKGHFLFSVCNGSEMWNAYVSTLMLGIATFFNCLIWYTYSNITVRMMATLWQFVVYMQFFEEISQESTQFSEYANYGTFTFNMLQPIVVGIVVICLSTNALVRYTLSALVLMYILAVTFQYNSVHIEDTPTFELYWWKDMSYYVFPLYLIIIIISLLSITPQWLGVYTIGYIIAALVASNLLYARFGSTLGWFISLAPFYTYLVLKANKFQN